MTLPVLDIDELEAFVVRAKAATYVGSGEPVESSRTGSHDLAYAEGRLAYLDSYVGGSDFLGEEVVSFDGNPVWGMNYYGYITRPDLIDAVRAGAVIKESLAELYRLGRFLGGHRHMVGDCEYFDTNEGDVTHFTGTEWITRSGVRVYELVYHGGLVQN
jgi:hypothetical protein